jgi:Domain of unknown function (DUF4105)
MKNLRFGLYLLLITFPIGINSQAEVNAVSSKNFWIQVEQEKPWSEPMWLALGHYRKNWILPGYTSEIDDPKFFLNKNGKTNPEKELKSTLKLFLESTSKPNSKVCRFQARLQWFSKRFPEKLFRLPKLDCPKFENWYLKVNGDSLAMVFPTTFLNSPASMFGHTFFRFDKKGKPVLLSYIANYAAETGGENALFYAYKGLFGKFGAAFSVDEYHKKVKQYNDLESRDVWEYKLNFTPEEIELIVKHLWELRNIVSEYYYFDENCSYQLLTVLDVARPELKLSEEFPFRTIPIDTVRSTVEKKDMLSDIYYRPSATTIMAKQLDLLSSSEKKLAKAISKDLALLETSKFKKLPEDKQALILEFEAEYIQYLDKKKKIKKKESRNSFLTLLNKRSLLALEKATPEIPIPTTPPHLGHKTRKLVLGVGKNDNQSFSEIKFRPAYHDVLDPSEGYQFGAQINFFDTAIRHYESEKIKLEKFTAIDVLSLSPRDDFFSSLSWEVKAQLIRKNFDEDRPLLLDIHGGAGVSYELANKSLFYALAGPEINYSDDLEDNYSFGLLPKIGILSEPHDKFAINLSAQTGRRFLGETSTVVGAIAETRISVTRNFGFRFSASREKDYDKYVNEYLISLESFF